MVDINGCLERMRTDLGKIYVDLTEDSKAFIDRPKRRELALALIVQDIKFTEAIRKEMERSAAKGSWLWRVIKSLVS